MRYNWKKKKSAGITRQIEEKPGGWRVKGNRDGGREETNGLSDGWSQAGRTGES